MSRHTRPGTMAGRQLLPDQTRLVAAACRQLCDGALPAAGVVRLGALGGPARRLSSRTGIAIEATACDTWSMLDRRRAGGDARAGSVLWWQYSSRSSSNNTLCVQGVLWARNDLTGEPSPRRTLNQADTGPAACLAA